MSVLNDYYLSELDLTLVRDFILDNGEWAVYPRNTFFIRQHERGKKVGFIEDGLFRYTRSDSSGKEHLVGYSLANDFVGEYTSCLCNRESLVNIQAVKVARVCCLPYSKLEEFWNSSEEKQHLGRLVAEQLFVMTYRRLMDRYCCTPEERYRDLMNRYPNLKELLPLREIASFIGVTPETISHIRRKIREE